MLDQPELHAASVPLRYEPGFIGMIRERAATRGIAPAIADVFAEANITVEVTGGAMDWNRPGRGALMLGDHRLGIEMLPLLAVLGSAERKDVHVIGKPFATQARLLGSLSVASADVILPVVPSTLASDRRDVFNRDLYWRLTNRSRLPSLDEVRRRNAVTLQQSVDLVEDGHAVVLCPTGAVADATKRPWQRGVGKIIQQLPEAAWDTTTIVPFWFDSFSRLGLVRSLVQASHGGSPRPRTLTMQLGKQGTPSELLGDLGALDALSITEVLRQQFVDVFGSGGRNTRG
jgi:hypothetical protein